MWTTLGEIGKWQAGGTPNRTIKSYYGGEIPWLKTGDLNDGIIENIPESITEEALQNSSAKLNPTNSILIAMYGATIGKLGILSYPAATNQACCACIEYSAVEKYYLFYFLLSHRHHFIYKGGGGAQPNISKEKILNTAIPLPPIEEQRRIIKAIEKWFLIINIVEANKNEALECIKVAKNKILDLAIHGKLVPQHPADEPAIKLLKRVNPSAEITCDNEHYPHLPNGWCIAPMKLLCSLEDGRKEENIERFNIDVKFLRGEREAKSINNGRYVAANSLLILVDGENSGEVFRTPIEGYQGSTFRRLVINENMCEEYLLNVISSHRKVLRENKVGSAIPHLNKKLFKEIEVPIPPVNEQRRIVSAINTLFNYIDNIAENL